MSLKIDFEIMPLDWTHSLVRQTTLKQLGFLVKAEVDNLLFKITASASILA